MMGEKVRLNRRRFLELSAGATAGAALATRGAAVQQAGAQELAEVPREKTLILVGVGGEAPNQFTDVDYVNPLGPTGLATSRSGYQLVYEPLWFYNMLTGEEKAWLAESYTYNADFTEIAVKLRAGVEWSDGTPFTSNDVQFNFFLQRDTAGLSHNADMKQWIADVVVADDLNLTIKLTAANPRFFFLYLTHHADNGMLMVPKHIWEGQDPFTFKNFDLAAGLPVATGPYRLVASSQQQKIWDLRTDWWAAKTGFSPLPAPERLIFLPGFDEAKMAQMVIANEADTTLNISPATMPTLFARNPKIITHSGQDTPYGYTDWWPSGLSLNCEAEPWNDPEIRWAISYAINREELVQFGYRGAGEPTCQVP